MKLKKSDRRQRIHKRIRKHIVGTSTKPRLSVYRSNKQIYAQLIDDVTGKTITSASSTETSVSQDGSKVEQSKLVGKLLAEKAISKNITNTVFDRSGYLYHGRVKSLAEGAREGGLIF